MSKETRSCGNCTVCCEGWLVINTEEIKAYPGLACPDVKCGKGCGIYETRPNYPCRTFFVVGPKIMILKYFLIG